MFAGKDAWKRTFLRMQPSRFNGARLCSPGRTLFRIPTLPQDDELQWGPALFAGKDAMTASDATDLTALQWGPALFAGKDAFDPRVGGL